MFKIQTQNNLNFKIYVNFILAKLSLSLLQNKPKPPMWPQAKNPQSNCMFYKKCPGQSAHNEINPVHLPSCAISRPKLPLSCYAPELFLKPKAINVFGERTNPQITQCALCRLASVRLWDNILHPATTLDKDTQGHLSPVTLSGTLLAHLIQQHQIHSFS